MILVKKGSLEGYLPRYFNSFLILLSVWLLISWFFRKYYFRDYFHFRLAVRPILISNFVILGTISLLMYFFRVAFYSRTIVFGTILVATVIELFLGLLYHFIKAAKENETPTDNEYLALKAQQNNGYNGLNENNENLQTQKLSKHLEKIIVEECGKESLRFIQKNNVYPSSEIQILATTNPINIQTHTNGRHRSLINLKRINDIRYLNEFFIAANKSLPRGGSFTCCVETKDLRKQRIFRKFLFPINYLIYYFIDFPVKRILPKFNLTRRFYFILTRGQNRVITRAETLGRLIACGFEVEDEEYIDNLCYIKVKKVKNPSNNGDPVYGPMVRLKRVGKNGKPIKVYKMRTMYPYAEYLQDYIYKHNNLKKGGKFNNDFRVSTQGKVMRRIWLDELPMLINLSIGDLKLVGVRPLSEHYFNLYSEDLQKKRINYKPGLVPPYYADMPKSLDEIQTSEIKYLEAYDKAPFRTDWKYFWKAWYNIVFKKARSQ